jgi:hypothetical protein
MQAIPPKSTIPQLSVLRRPEPQQRIVVFGSPELGASVAESYPKARVDVFAPDWQAVRRGRALLMRRALENRMSVHHRSVAGNSWGVPTSGVTNGGR